MTATANVDISHGRLDGLRKSIVSVAASATTSVRVDSMTTQRSKSKYLCLFGGGRWACVRHRRLLISGVEVHDPRLRFSESCECERGTKVALRKTMSTPRTKELALVISCNLAGVLAMAGCGDGPRHEEVANSSGQELEATGVKREGERLFFEETFHGNGRTCGTCHSKETGTLNPQQVNALFQRDPNGPLFRGDGADSPGSDTFDRIRANASIRVVLPLPANVSIVGSPARTIALQRGIPTTMNTPALDPVLMYDGRAPNLTAQAEDAILGHAESSAVTADQLNLIADFEKSLFNDGRLKTFAAAGVVPELPRGNTPSELRGRVFFTDDNPVNGNPPRLRCVHCHTGPMLNETSPGLQVLFGVPIGERFTNALVPELNPGNLPVYTFRFTNPDGTTTDVTTPDPGRALQTGDPVTANRFKIPTLWGATKTAPYFHDNSALDVPAMLRHYDNVFNVAGTDLTEQDMLDIAAYMKLL
jgi:cytochrome c peroxidase